MKSVVLTLLFVLSGGILYAQSNFRSGYIITSANDTITGLIDYRTDQMNALNCTFKKSETSPEEQYTPGQIAGFRFTEDGKFYVSHEIVLNGITQLVFLEYMVQGMMNLYFYADKITDLNYYIFENRDGEMKYVTKKPDEIIETPSKLLVKKDLQYKRDIILLFHTVPDLVEEAKKIDFTQESMIAIVKDYHDLTCKTGEACIVFEGAPDKKYWRFKFSAYAGIYMLSASFRLSDMYHPLQNNLMMPAVGLQINVYIPRLSKSLSTQFDFSISYGNNRTGYSYLRRLPSGIFELEKKYIDYKIYAGFLQMSEKYTYHKGIVRPFVEVGVGFMVELEPRPYNDSAPKIWRSEEEFGNMLESRPYDSSFVTGVLHGGVGLNFQITANSAIFLSVTCDILLRTISGYIPALKLGYTF